jgi:hypothetical protein
MDFYTAADRVSSEPVGAGRRYSLGGELHAVRVSEMVSLCGRANLHNFPEYVWPPSLPGANLCHACVAAVRDDIPTIEVTDPPPGWPGSAGGR